MIQTRSAAWARQAGRMPACPSSLMPAQRIPEISNQRCRRSTVLTSKFHASIGGLRSVAARTPVRPVCATWRHFNPRIAPSRMLSETSSSSSDRYTARVMFRRLSRAADDLRAGLCKSGLARPML